LRRLDSVHSRRSSAELAGVAGAALSGWRTGGVVVCHRPVGRHAVLQCHHLPGDARRVDELRVQQARLAAGLARVDLLSRLRCDRLSRVAAPWMVAGARQPGVVAAGRQHARLHLLWNLSGRRLRRSFDRLHARPGRRELEHMPGRGLLPRMCARCAEERAGFVGAPPTTRTWRTDACVKRLQTKAGPGRQLSVTNQNWGSPWTRARCMTFRSASDETKALATSAVSKSCQRVTSVGSSTNWNAAAPMTPIA